MHTELNHLIANITRDITEMDCSGDTKAKLAADIAHLINQSIPKTERAYDEAQFSQLQQAGIVSLDNLFLNNAQVKDIVNYFTPIPVYNGHVPAQSDGQRRPLGKAARQFAFGSYPFHEVILSPHLLELAFHPAILGLVQRYLGCTPTIYSFNTWWSFPGHAAGVAQDYHRDIDDYKFLALFIYLTDVEGGSKGGQHRFITRTHDDQQLLHLLGNDHALANTFLLPHLKHNGYYRGKRYEKLFASQIQDITGRAGAVFLADTYAFHKGMPPIDHDRLVCWIRYGLRENLTYGNDKLHPVPTAWLGDRIPLNDTHKYMLRLLTSDLADGTAAKNVKYGQPTIAFIRNLRTRARRLLSAMQELAT